jgi:D-alanyl-D-alanine carboxypeptidase
MSKKVFDFISSFGLMILGVGLLFAFTINITPMEKECRYFFPKSNLRTASGGDIEKQALPASRPTIPLVKNINQNFSATLTAYSAYVIDNKTGVVLFEKNADEVRALASITKLMSAIVLLDLPINWEATTMVEALDCDTDSHHINPGEIFKQQDLWSIGLIGSSNSAIRTLVRTNGFTNDQFAEKMNAKAKELGLVSMKFTEPTGLSATNVGNAKDVVPYSPKL